MRYLAFLGLTACSASLCAQVPHEHVERVASEARAAMQLLESPDADQRSLGRQRLRDLGADGIAALRQIVGASADVDPQELLVRATGLARQRRRARVEIVHDVGEEGWRVRWWHDGTLAILNCGESVRFRDAAFEWISDRELGSNVTSFAHSENQELTAFAQKKTVVLCRADGSRQVLRTKSDQPSIAFSPDGALVALGGFGRDVQLHRTSDGKLLRMDRAKGTLGALSPVFSPDGKTLAIGNRNGVTQLVDVKNGDVLHVLDRQQTHQLAFAPTGRQLAVAYVDGKIGIWNVETGTLERLFDSRDKEVFCLTWSPDAEFLASGGHNGPVVVWSMRYGGSIRELDADSERVFSLAFDPDGHRLVAVGRGRTRMWSIRP
ncbi:MAG: PD40 domain-containing protein [Planctomycetes bacterium]|nr:PD40 domain-containing protein [Planctomycetota bacterium]